MAEISGKGSAKLVVKVARGTQLYATVTFFSTLTNDLNNLQSHVGRFEGETKDSLKETRNKQDEMNLAIAKILERFDRLFDKLNDKKQK